MFPKYRPIHPYFKRNFSMICEDWLLSDLCCSRWCHCRPGLQHRCQIGTRKFPSQFCQAQKQDDFWEHFRGSSIFEPCCIPKWKGKSCINNQKWHPDVYAISHATVHNHWVLNGCFFFLFLELGQIMNPIRFVYWWIHPTIGTSSFLLWKTCCTNIHFPTFRFAVPLAILMTTRGKLEENSLRSSACNMYMLHVALLAASMSEDMLDSTTRALVRWHFDLQQQLFGCAFKWAPQCFCRSSWTWTRTKWWAHREQEHIPIKVSSIDWEETAPTATSLKLTHPKHDAWKTTVYFPVCNGTCMCCDVSNILLQCHPTPFHTSQTPSLVAYLHILLPTQIRFF